MSTIYSGDFTNGDVYENVWTSPMTFTANGTGIPTQRFAIEIYSVSDTESPAYVFLNDSEITFPVNEGETVSGELQYAGTGIPNPGPVVVQES